MKKRPLSIRLLSLLFLLAPIGFMAELIYLYDIPLKRWDAVFSPEIWTWQVVAIVIITPLVGLCIWTTRRWAYFVLLTYSGLILVNNIAVWLSGKAMSGILERLVLLAGLAVLLFTELRKQFYAPYFNPRLRWWEQAIRYSTDRIHIVVREFGKGTELFQANSFDVSETGIYIVSDREVKIGDMFSMDVVLPGNKMSHASGEVVWTHVGDNRYPRGFGCRFTTTGRHFKTEVRDAVRALNATMKNR
jgi:hypothetical protein